MDEIKAEMYWNCLMKGFALWVWLSEQSSPSFCRQIHWARSDQFKGEENDNINESDVLGNDECQHFRVHAVQWAHITTSQSNGQALSHIKLALLYAIRATISAFNELCAILAPFGTRRSAPGLRILCENSTEIRADPEIGGDLLQQKASVFCFATLKYLTFSLQNPSFKRFRLKSHLQG